MHSFPCKYFFLCVCKANFPVHGNDNNQGSRWADDPEVGGVPFLGLVFQKEMNIFVLHSGRKIRWKRSWFLFHRKKLFMCANIQTAMYQIRHMQEAKRGGWSLHRHTDYLSCVGLIGWNHWRILFGCGCVGGREAYQIYANNDRLHLYWNDFLSDFCSYETMIRQDDVHAGNDLSWSFDQKAIKFLKGKNINLFLHSSISIFGGNARVYFLRFQPKKNPFCGFPFDFVCERMATQCVSTNFFQK